MITEDETERLYNQTDDCIQKAGRLRASHDMLLAAAKQAFCMIDKARYENTPPYNAVLAAIAASEEHET